MGNARIPIVIAQLFSHFLWNWNKMMEMPSPRSRADGRHCWHCHCWLLYCPTFTRGEFIMTVYNLPLKIVILPLTILSAANRTMISQIHHAERGSNKQLLLTRWMQNQYFSVAEEDELKCQTPKLWRSFCMWPVCCLCVFLSVQKTIF